LVLALARTQRGARSAGQCGHACRTFQQRRVAEVVEAGGRAASNPNGCAPRRRPAGPTMPVARPPPLPARRVPRGRSTPPRRSPRPRGRRSASRSAASSTQGSAAIPSARSTCAASSPSRCVGSSRRMRRPPASSVATALARGMFTRAGHRSGVAFAPAARR
jgi:hypothetical protein